MFSTISANQPYSSRESKELTLVSLSLLSELGEVDGIFSAGGRHGDL